MKEISLFQIKKNIYLSTYPVIGLTFDNGFTSLSKKKKKKRKKEKKERKDNDLPFF